MRQLRTAITQRLPQAVPKSFKLGALVMLAGVAFDAYVHLFAVHSHSGTPIGPFSLPEHSAHLIVVLGMLIVLGGVIVNGVAASRNRASDLTGGNDAIR
jgi:hypothetical protein